MSSRATRIAPWGHLGAAAVLAVAALATAPLETGCAAGRDSACADDAECPGTPPHDDGGVRGDSDAAGGVLIDAASESDAGALGPPPMSSREGVADPAQCFDGLDNDAWAGADCTDELCRAQPVCCVGVVSDACCTSPVGSAALPALDGCAAGPAAACAALASSGATLLGFPSISADHALIPGGTSTADHGVVLAGELDPRSARVSVSATIAASAACDGCIDAVTISLAPESAIGPSVRGAAGVMVSRSRQDVSLLIGGAIVWSASLPPGGAARSYALAVDPTGEVALAIEGEEVATSTVALPDAPLRVVVHGRTANPSGAAGEPARVRSVVASATGCDVPASLARAGSPLGRPPSPSWPEGGASAPSIARPEGADASATRLAFAAAGAIWIAQPDGLGGFEVNASVPALAQGDWAPRGVGEPELVALADRWRLYFTAVGADGLHRLARVDGPSGWGETFDPTRIVDVVRLPLADAAGTIVELDGASVAEVGGAPVIAARARRADGSTSLVLLRGGAAGAADDFELDGVCGTGCAAYDADTTSSPVHRAGEGAVTAFDHDEVASPALVYERGVWRLYYAGRRGTRWSIGLLVSYDLSFFRDGNGGRPVLAGSGRGEDALGVLDPEAWSEDGRLTLFHTGTDGVTTHVLAATQPIATAP